MDRLIRTAWRAFWVGLGASAVLIGQSVLTPAPATTADPGPAPLVAPAPMTSPATARLRPLSADPILSRNRLSSPAKTRDPFDSKTGSLLAQRRGS
jgi:hypothetical protein